MSESRATNLSADRAGWDNIPPRTPGHLNEARERVTRVLDDDPFVRMFSPEVRACMVEAFLRVLKSGPYYKVEDGLETDSHRSVTRDLNRAAKGLPLGFVGDDFKQHLVALVAFALIPKPDFDEWGLPV